ncbi:hypothetical protein BD410DRAFT_274438 [Rickenella mellea]|uniref:Uncharacterized protein n=1 Tax=Rickenella mellea TaxID=50990 RepID=A0A4Y7Q440_9AGAM|nr:hypothetical protein BD410DRAFT_274438 [Rickenella mellea]
MTRFGDFQALCHQTPSYPWCNLFYRQLLKHSPTTLTGLSANPKSAPVGVNPECGALRVNNDGSLGNIANIIVCGLGFFFVIALVFWSNRRRAAVGRDELKVFLIMYLFTLPLQLITTGSLLEQGSTALVVLTAIHAGAVAATFWALLANGLVATQIVEDGTLSSLIPFLIFIVAFFAATLYIALDVGLTITKTFGPSNPPASLHSIPLFVLTSIWPGFAALVYFLIMAYIVLGVLRERKPMGYYLLAGVLFVLSQLDYFLLNKIICKGTKASVDGSFIATILETAAVGALYLGWRSITEESWDDDQFYRS